ncbi:MAG: hypothetical protein KF886_16745 [Candidatus Hydrogenedentes bacterium]|nr:hypothetical protein [Candidatus Hydrogenedentota bacterium]
MKKWLIVVLVLVGVLGAAALVAGFRLNQQYGWLPAEPVSHATLATADTRFRLYANTLRLGEDLTRYFPADLPKPAWLPWDLPALLPRVAPREVAVLGGSDFREGRFNLTLFVNEQRGGPALPYYLNTRTRFRQAIEAIAWDDPGFSLSQRGVLTARGHLELPPALEEEVRATWQADPPAELLALSGGHMAEGVIDNRNGDILAILGALAPIWNTNLDLMRQTQQGQLLFPLLPGVRDVRFAVDFKDQDTLVIQVRIHADPDEGRQLEFIAGMGLTMLTRDLQVRYGLVLTTEKAWRPEEETYVVDATVAGVEAKLKDYFQRMFPATPAAAPQAAE